VRSVNETFRFTKNSEKTSVHSVQRSGIKNAKAGRGKPRNSSNPKQLTLFQLPLAGDVLEEMARNAERGVEERGAIFTKKEIVEFILDLVGYTTERPLYTLRTLEPSFGQGAFLLPIVERLLKTFTVSTDIRKFERLHKAIFAVELHRSTFEETRSKLAAKLKDAGLHPEQVESVLSSWLKNADFLLEPLTPNFDFVIGNPPYVRQERIPDILLSEYRRRFKTIYDRADLYIPFLEHSLTSLVSKGALGFICADRWMKNRYGGPLRQLVFQHFRLKYYVDMFSIEPFDSDVIAYPAVTVITREQCGSTRLAHKPKIDSDSLGKLSKALLSPQLNDINIKELSGILCNDDPWILESSDQIEIVRRLERDFPTLEDAGCKVGIGVATGADKVFIGKMEELDVEDDRKLPLAMTRDIQSGEVQWRGFGVINPFRNDGGLVNLDDYPRLKRYLFQRDSELRARHVSKKNPEGWFRTIDRITPALARAPKLLIPDIKENAHIVYEDGNLYPHHNLYFITSTGWDLKALRALLMSGTARLFVATYSTKMHGGFMRFQAQYLRRIRIPRWNKVPEDLREQLIDAANEGDLAACNVLAFELYGFSQKEREALGGNGS
jgi:hypothetical protein